MERLSVLGVGAIIKKGDKYLIIQEASNNTSIGKAMNSYGFPMGHVNRGENVIDAVKREVKEETGYSITIIDIVGFYDLTGAFGIAFRAELSSSMQDNYDKSEVKKVSWLTKEELLGKKLRPAVKEAISDFEVGIFFDLSTITLI